MKNVKADAVERELLGEQSKALLKELHLLTRTGDLNADARRKLKQINHFAGFIQPVLQDLFARHGDVQIVDVASGNAYLGFILYELFFSKRDDGRIHSVESRAELVQRGMARAQSLGYPRMRFEHAAIRDAKLPERVHLLTALHACDTATDEALLAAVRKKVDYVFLVPCCQAEVAQLLKDSKADGAGRLLYRENLHRREFGSHLTNVMRCLALQAEGYQVTVTELTSWEHTAKTELIIGKRVQGFDAQAKADLLTLAQSFDIKPRLLVDLYG